MGLIVLLVLLLSFGEQEELLSQPSSENNPVSLFQSRTIKPITPPSAPISYMLEEGAGQKQTENPTSGIVYSLSDHSCTVDAIDFSPDGRTLVSGGGCGHIIVHNATNGLKIKSWKGSQWTIKKISFGLKGSIIASGSGPGTLVKIYNSESYQLLETLSYPREHGGVEALIFSNDGQTLKSGDTFGSIFSWDLRNYSLLDSWVGNFDLIHSLAFNPQGTIIASGEYSGAVKLWNASDGTLLRNIGNHTSSVSSLCFSHDSNILASGSDEVKIWNVTDGTLIDTLIGHSDKIYSLNFQADGEFLASGASSGVIKIWSLTNGSLLATLNEHTSHIYGLNFHPDGITLASASSDHMIKVWNLLNFINYNNASDNDLDGIPSDWELENGLNDSCYWDRFNDDDNDGLMNILEFKFRTNPLIADSDDDMISDSYEYLNHLNGTSDDSQGDKDKDTMPNIYEYQYGLFADINDSQMDKDKDGLSNLYEFLNNLSPNNSDSDFDGMDDLWEVENGLNPLVDDSNEDPDEDGYTNIQEYLNGTDPHSFTSRTTTTSSITTSSSIPVLTAGFEFLLSLLAIITIISSLKRFRK